MSLYTISVMSRCSAVLWSVVYLLLCAGATSTNTFIRITPRNLTVRDGESATFTCEVPCTHEVSWYIGDLHNSFSLPFEDSLPEIAYSRSFSPEQGCSPSGTFNDSITFGATSELNDVAIQCSVQMIMCDVTDDMCGVVSYSRFRVLRVTSSDDDPSPSPSPSSCGSPSVEEIVCPSPSSVLVTTTETSTVRETVTSTHIVTETVILKPSVIPVLPTDCPTADAPRRSDGSVLLSRLQLSAATLLLLVSVFFVL